MVVREEHRVDPVDSPCEPLQTQLVRRVEQQTRAASRFDDRPNTIPAIAGVRRSTNRTVAPDLRDAKAGAGAEKRELHTTSTFTRLVVPGTSKGTPAVTSTRSPTFA